MTTTAGSEYKALAHPTRLFILPHVSFANCGLPYFVGGEIAEPLVVLKSGERLDSSHGKAP